MMKQQEYSLFVLPELALITRAVYFSSTIAEEKKQN